MAAPSRRQDGRSGVSYMQRSRVGRSLRADAPRPKSGGVESGDVDEGPVRASSAHRLRRNVDAAVRVAERRHDLGPDFVPVARDRRAERGMEVLRPDATGGESVERGVEDARGGAPPAGVDGGDPARPGIREDDRNAVGRGHREEDVRLAGQEAVAFSEEGVPALSRGCFEGKNAAAVDLREAHDLGVRRFQRAGERPAGLIFVQRSRRQRSPREPGRESVKPARAA